MCNDPDEGSFAPCNARDQRKEIHMMHDMLWLMIAAGTLKFAVLALGSAALVKYLFFTRSSANH
jgi:hypothetical protein